MNATNDIRLARLLQLASPTLPVGAYSYSQGLEAAIDAGVVSDAQSAGAWISDVLHYTVARTEAPILLRLIASWRAGEFEAVERWNGIFLASRETAELRAESVQMGYSLNKLLSELVQASELEPLGEISFPAAFAYAVAKWEIQAESALIAYLWAWIENQVMAAVKAVPLGQTDGQRLLLSLAECLPVVAQGAATIADDDLGGFAPRFALLSSQHETQYSRLFRS